MLQHQIEEYIDYCENVRLMTPVTIAEKRDILTRFVKTVDCPTLEQLTNQHINNYIKGEIARGLKARSINCYMQQIIAFIRYSKEMGIETQVKLPLIPKLKEEPPCRNYYDYKTIKKVIDNSDEVQSLMISICFDTGMRITELTNLKIKDFKGSKVTFIGKGRIHHESYIRPETKAKLKKYIESYDISSYLWAERGKTKPMTAYSVSMTMRRAFEANGIEGFHPHALRHSFATDLQKKGASIEEIQKMIGHSNTSVTECYLHSFDSLEPLFKKYQKI